MPVFWSKNSKKKNPLYICIYCYALALKYILQAILKPPYWERRQDVFLEPQKLLALNQSVIITF